MRRLLIALAGLVLAAAAPQPGVPNAATALLAQAKDAVGADPALATQLAQKARAMAAALPAGGERTTDLATADWLQGEAAVRMNKVDDAGPLLERAYGAIGGDQAPTSKLKGDILLSRGWLDLAKADVAGALAKHQAAYDIFRAIGEARSQAIALQSLGSLYRSGNDFQTALRYYAQAQEVYSGDLKMSLAMSNNRATALSGLDRHAEASVELEKALAIARTLGSTQYQAVILYNLARQYLALGQLDRAEKSVATGLTLARDAQAKGWRSPLTALAAELALRRGNVARAKALIGEAFAGVDLTQTDVSLREAHDWASQIYTRAGDAAMAFRHLSAVQRLDEQTAKLTASADTALMAAKFNFANQNLKIATLQKEDLQRRITYQRSQARLQQRVFAGAAMAALLVVALLGAALFTVRRSRNEVRAANVDLERTNGALAKALAAKTEFLATTSHEIRTPLNGILGMTQVMLADRGLDGATRDRIGVVHGAGVTMKALVDDILDVAKMETGNLTIDTAPLELPVVLRELCRLWDEQAKGKGLDFTLHADAAPAWIEGDAARLRQVLFNLLSNAVKFTERGGVTLAAHVAGDRLRITVADTGIGIEPDKREVIFESFRQADSGTTRRFGGTGLGLAICRNLARAMDGDILVESMPGAGSTFTLDLPLVLAAAPAAVPASEGGALLIVDRNPITRSMLKALFAPKVPAVLFAGSLAEGAETVAGGGIATVVIDEATAKATGDELAAALPGFAGARAYLLWTAPDGDIVQSTSDSGVEIVEKPIAGAALVARVVGEHESMPTMLVSRAA